MDSLMLMKGGDFGVVTMSRVNGVKLKEALKKVNDLLEKLNIDSITGMNDTVYYGAAMVCEILGVKKEKRYD